MEKLCEGFPQATDMNKGGWVFRKFYKKIHIAFSISGSAGVGAKEFHTLHRIFSHSLMNSGLNHFQCWHCVFPLSSIIIQEMDGFINSNPSPRQEHRKIRPLTHSCALRILLL